MTVPENNEDFQGLPRSGEGFTALPVLTPDVGYDLVARHYDSWKWQRVWRGVEWPCVDQLLASIDASSGGLATVLDVGVGTGSYLQHAIDKFHFSSCYGVDVSRSMLKLAEGKLQDHATLLLGDARNLPFPDEKFDAVLMCRVASHLEECRSAIIEIRRVLHCGGFLILSDIDPRHPYRHTRVPYGQSKISIATFKHPMEEWISVVEELGFQVKFRRVFLSDEIATSQRNVELPSSLSTQPPHPISYVLCAQKYTC
jgi:ubiquinone/menaquinone biosynthesis C-methylase UbiE